MHDPVIAADGYTYERTAIADWLEREVISPVTGEVLSHVWLVPNLVIKSLMSQSL